MHIFNSIFVRAPKERPSTTPSSYHCSSPENDFSIPSIQEDDYDSTTNLNSSPITSLHDSSPYKNNEPTIEQTSADDWYSTTIDNSLPVFTENVSNTDPTKSNNMDVFFASGNFSKTRLGNLALTKICKQFQDQYQVALKSQQRGSNKDSNATYKSDVLRKIIFKFKSDNPSSKIWTRKNDGDGSEWIDITHDETLIISKPKAESLISRKSQKNCRGGTSKHRKSFKNKNYS